MDQEIELDLTSVSFHLEPEEIRKLQAWKSSPPLLEYAGNDSGKYTYCFTPTVNGTVCVVLAANGEMIHLSDIYNTERGK